MGLSRTSTGRGASESDASAVKTNEKDRIVALAGNPNVGKSTVFNSLTGMKQHTGNWTGKTVTSAIGKCKSELRTYIFADLPGCYSLSARSAEEEVARDYIYFGNSDRIAVVCDASCLERNFFLVIQILEVCENAAVCINLIDEAEKRGLIIDEKALSEQIGVPVAAMSARKGKEARRLLPALEAEGASKIEVKYKNYIENYITDASALLCGNGVTRRQARVFALRILDSDNAFVSKLADKYNIGSEEYKAIEQLAKQLKATHCKENSDAVNDDIAEAISSAASRAVAGTVRKKGVKRNERDRKIDKLLIGRVTGFPIMLLMLLAILWLTVQGANYPSELLSRLFAAIEAGANMLLVKIGATPLLTGLICEGIIRVVGWVISVMLPPMAIFFPLFTILEDMGYLPRVAFNLDRCFKKCSACGKQALTMCMGFGCNAAGVVGCRIIDSPRERLIAILTNSFMPCNGRFPMLIAIITMFFAASSGIVSAAVLTAIIIISVLITLLVSKLLSITVLKGVPSSFTLELPPYRTPQFGKVLVRSIFDRTLFVLGRAVAVAAPTGLVIWLLANVTVGSGTLLSALSGFLNPLGQLMGLDGVILLAFLLGMPANEIVIPIIMMCYMANGTLVGYSSLSELKSLLVDNGWTLVTAINMIIFTVFHWPCSTTILTIKKESGSWAHTAAAIAIPTIIGITLCILINMISRIF